MSSKIIDFEKNLEYIEYTNPSIPWKLNATYIYHDNTTVTDSTFDPTNNNLYIESSGSNIKLLVTDSNIIELDGNVEIKENKDMNIYGNLIVHGDTSFGNLVVASSTVNISEKVLRIASDATTDTLANDAGLEIRNNFIKKSFLYKEDGNQWLSNIGLGANGLISANSGLDVSGTILCDYLLAENVDLSGSLTVVKDTSIMDLSAQNVDLSGDLLVAGQSKMLNVVAQNVDLSGYLTVVNHTSIMDLSCHNVDLSGSLAVVKHTSIMDLSAQNVDLSGSLAVVKHTSIMDLSCQNVDLSGSLTVVKDTSIMDLSAQNVDLSGDLLVAGQSKMLNVVAQNVDLSGYLTVVNHTSIMDLSCHNVDLSGNLTVNGYTKIDGQTTIMDLSAQNLDLSGDLLVDGTITCDDLSILNINNKFLYKENDNKWESNIDLDVCGTFTCTSLVTDNFTITNLNAQLFDGSSSSYYLNYHNDKFAQIDNCLNSILTDGRDVLFNDLIVEGDISFNKNLTFDASGIPNIFYDISGMDLNMIATTYFFDTLTGRALDRIITFPTLTTLTDDLYNTLNLKANIANPTFTGIISLSGNIIPEISNTYDIGSIDKPFGNIYATDASFTHVEISNNFIVNDKVGIGTTNPVKELDVSGEAYISSKLGVGMAPSTVSGLNLVVNADAQFGYLKTFKLNESAYTSYGLMHKDYTESEEDTYYAFKQQKNTTGTGYTYVNAKSSILMGNNGTTVMAVYGDNVRFDQRIDAYNVDASFNNVELSNNLIVSNELIIGDTSNRGGRIFSGSENNTLIIDPYPKDDNNEDNSGNVYIRGNLFVEGIKTQINSTTLDISDINIVVAKNATTSTIADGAGVTVGNNIAQLKYQHDNSKWKSNIGLDISGNLIVDGTISSSTITNIENNVSTLDSSVNTLESYNLDQIKIDTSGKVGIGTADPSNNLHVLGDALFESNDGSKLKLWYQDEVHAGLEISGKNQFHYLFSTNWGSFQIKNRSNGPLDFYTGPLNSNLNRLRITNDGKVGIGTSTPSETLDISGTLGVSSNIYANDASFNNVEISNNLIMNNTIICRNIEPEISNTYDLGSIDKPFRDLYVSENTIHMGEVLLTIDDTNQSFKVKKFRSDWETKREQSKYHNFGITGITDKKEFLKALRSGGRHIKDVEDIFEDDSISTSFLELLNTTAEQTVTIRSSDSTSEDYTLILPVDNGSTDQILQTNGSGVLSWTDPYSLPTATSSTLGGVKIGYTKSGKNYPVELHNEKMFVNVPWTDTVYSLPTASSSTLGGVKIGYTKSGKNYPVELHNEKMFVNVPWTDTVYSLPTASSSTLGGVKIGYTESGKNYPVELENSSNKMFVHVPWTTTATGFVSDSWLYAGSKPRFYFSNNGHSYYRTGNQHIFRNNGDTDRVQFDANGNGYFDGNVTAYYSDERLKEKLGNIKNSIEKVKTIETFYYKENDLAKKLGFNNDKKQIGLSAQSVEKVLPECVSLAPFDFETHDDKTITSKSGENYKTVDYSRIVPLLIEAIKEQQKQIDELKNEILEIKGKN